MKQILIQSDESGTITISLKNVNEFEAVGILKLAAAMELNNLIVINLN